MRECNIVCKGSPRVAMRLNLQMKTGIFDEQLGQLLKGVFVFFSDVGFVKVPVNFRKYEVNWPWDGGAGGCGNTSSDFHRGGRGGRNSQILRNGRGKGAVLREFGRPARQGF